MTENTKFIDGEWTVVLEPEDMTEGTFGDVGNPIKFGGRCCLAGWADRVQLNGGIAKMDLLRALVSEAERMGISRPITTMNDQILETNRERADFWNQAMLHAGFIDAEELEANGG